MAEVKLTEETRSTPLVPVDAFPSNRDMGIVDKKVGKPGDDRPKPKSHNVAVIKRKETVWNKFKRLFFGEEAIDVKDYLVTDVLIPGVKDILDDILTATKDAILFGDARPRRSSSRRDRGGRDRSYVSYESMYDRKSSRDRVSRDDRKQPNEYIFKSKAEAEDVLSDMISYIDEYHYIRISDLNDMLHISGEFTDTYWGWDNLSSATVKRIAEGYQLVLPKAVRI